MRLMMTLAVALLWSNNASAQPVECQRCDWTWRLYVHERDKMVLTSCQSAVAQGQATGVQAIVLDMAFLLQRYSGLPYTRFEIDLAREEPPDCRAITRPALNWLYDVYISWCLYAMPQECHAYYPRP